EKYIWLHTDPHGHMTKARTAGQKSRITNSRKITTMFLPLDFITAEVPMCWKMALNFTSTLLIMTDGSCAGTIPDAAGTIHTRPCLSSVTTLTLQPQPATLTDAPRCILHTVTGNLPLPAPRVLRL